MCPIGFVNFTQLKNCSIVTLTLQLDCFVRLKYLFSRCFHFTLPVFSFQSAFLIALGSLPVTY